MWTKVEHKGFGVMLSMSKVFHAIIRAGIGLND